MMLKVLQSGDVARAESVMTAHIRHTRGLWVGRSGDEAQSG
jgi:DNA-binding GntR family transcriptional regulator